MVHNQQTYAPREKVLGAKAKIHEIFNKLVEDRKLLVRTSSKDAHENLRTRLVKLFSRHKKNLEDLDFLDGTEELSMCATYDETSGTSSYSVDRRKSAKVVEYEILTNNVRNADSDAELTEEDDGFPNTA